MVLESVCPPALLYLAFSIIQIIIDMYRGDTVQAFLKFIVMIIFTIVLNAICSSGMTIMSWFIVFIPFILMTYITTILFFVFGIDPSKITEQKKKCAQTQFGCCPDGVTPKEDMIGRGCPRTRLVNAINVKEPTPANNKDKHYLYPQGRSSRDYSIGGRSGEKDKKYLGDVNRDKNFYDYKKTGSYRDRLRSNVTPKAIDSKSSYWKSKLGKSYWDNDKTAQNKITAAATPATPGLQDKTIINYLLSLLAQTQPNLAAPAPGAPVHNPAPAPGPIISSPNTNICSPIITTNGTWTGLPTITYKYEWYRGGQETPIPNEVTNTYIIKEADKGNFIKSKVIATNSAGSAFKFSNEISIPASASGSAPVSTVLPVISVSSGSTNTVGSVITVSTGTWNVTPITTYSYEWYRTGQDTPIPGQDKTKNTYTITLDDKGKSITCKVTVTYSACSASATSLPFSIT
jgi:hypothetical protein